MLVPGAIVGIDLEHGPPAVAGLAVLAGRNLERADRGRAVVVLDRHFARYYGLPARGSVTASGGHRLAYVGQGLTPDSFIVLGPQQTQETAADYAVVFTSIETAQRLLSQPGQANELLLRVRSPRDVPRVEAQLRRALATSLPGVAFTINTKHEDPARISLLNTMNSTRRLYSLFAAMLLIGAAFGAFNLMVRIVESQRREIGIAMALGTPPLRIALRPLLIGLEVVVGGVIFGVGVGIFVDHLVGNVLRAYLPLPVWKTGFQPWTFAQGAADRRDRFVRRDRLARRTGRARAAGRGDPQDRGRAARPPAPADPALRQQHRPDAVPERAAVGPALGAHRARHRGDDGRARRPARSRRRDLRDDRQRALGDQGRRGELGNRGTRPVRPRERQRDPGDRGGADGREVTARSPARQPAAARLGVVRRPAQPPRLRRRDLGSPLERGPPRPPPGPGSCSRRRPRTTCTSASATA